MRFFVIFILSTVPFFYACKKSSAVDGSYNSNPGIQKSFLALGDSYTIGQSVDPSLRFPVQTKNLLQAEGLFIKDPQILATTGWTTINLLNAIQDANLQPVYDIVSLLAGVNDQYQFHDTTGYRMRFDQLISRSVFLAGGKPDHVFILSIPDYSVTPFAAGYDTMAIRIQIDQFNNINHELAIQRGCKYLDITPSTREARYDRSLIASDGLHPSGKEYAKWADRLAALIR
jgi:lysophospholipase L1-like esterase